MACVDGVVFAERRTPWDILQVRYIFISFSACCDGGRKKEELKLNKIKTAWKQIHTQWYNNWINLTRCSQKWNLPQQNIIERKLSQSDQKKKKKRQRNVYGNFIFHFECVLIIYSYGVVRSSSSEFSRSVINIAWPNMTEERRVVVGVRCWSFEWRGKSAVIRWFENLS